jgi:hypothetical protein
MSGFGMEDLRKLGLTEQEIIQLTGAESEGSFRGPTKGWAKFEIESEAYKIGFAASVSYSSGDMNFLHQTLIGMGRIAES